MTRDTLGAVDDQTTSSTGTQGERAASQIELQSMAWARISYHHSRIPIVGLPPKKQANERELCDTGTGSTIGEHTQLWPRGISSAISQTLFRRLSRVDHGPADKRDLYAVRFYRMNLWFT